MLVVHGFWSPGTGLCLWAEDSTRNVRSPSQARRSARPHPFAAPAEAMGGAAADETLRGKEGEAALLLPSLRSAPLDSPELVRVTPRPPARSAPTLLPWTVPTTAFDPPAAAAVLRALRQPASGVRPGSSVTYLSEVAELARELAARGRVLPTVTADGSGAAARWRPVLQGRDVLAVHGLATAMPPVARAVPGRDDPHELTGSALDALTDAAVRSLLPADVSLAPPRRGRRPRRLPATEAWLGALVGADGRLDADSGEVEVLRRSLAPWDQVGAGPDDHGVARATFRLTELTGEDGPPGADGEGEPVGAGDAGTSLPAVSDGDGDGDANGDSRTGDGNRPEDARWQVELLLQSTEDPSLLVPAGQVWADDGGLDRWLARPRELLLAELGRASLVYPDLAAALRQSRPSSLELDADGAYRFLSVAAPALDEAGFGVLVPSWWDRGGRLGLRLSASTPVDGVVAGTSRFGRDQLARYSWQLAVGDDALTEEEVEALAQAKAPLVRLRGRWVAVDRQQLDRGLAFLRAQRSGEKTASEIMALATSHPDDLDTPLPVTGVEADGWLGDLLDGAGNRQLAPVATPESFRAELRPYQQRGLSWLAFLSSLGLGACLADDMGLGKTIQLLALEAVTRAGDGRTGPGDAGEGAGMPPSLLICPTSLVGNWQREAARFAPELRVYGHHGRERHRGEDLDEHLAGVDLVITTYGTAARDIEDLARHRWTRLVLDEAQAIKNSRSRSSSTVRRLEAEHRVALTGTPLENRLAELWSIVDFLNPGVLGSSEQFRARYSVPIERHRLPEPAERLQRITRPYVLRRLKTDPAIIDDLPEKIEVRQYCRLTPEQATLYQSVVDDMMDRIEGSDGIERRGNVLAAMAKLKQVCNHPALLLHDRSPIGRRSGKVLRLEEILEELLAEGDRALCFTQYTELAEMLLPHLTARFGTEIAYLHGGTSAKRRDELVARFQSGDGPPVFLLSLKAGGTGLNLTAANHVIHLDRWWNPAVEDQATDRAFRIGQHRNVQVHKFVCTGTLEEHIDDMIEQKKALADMVVRSGEAGLTELSTADLREVLTLTEGAADE